MGKNEENQKRFNDIKNFMKLYKKNKGVKIQDLIIYGLLANQQLSGYDLFKILEHEANQFGPMMKTNKQSVYNFLKKMERIGDAKIVKVISDTNWPTKSLYALTDQGKERLNQMIRQELSRPPVIFNNLAGVLGIAQSLPKHELRRIVIEKIEQLEYMIEIEESYQNIAPGALLRVLAKSKVDSTRVLLQCMKDALKVIDENDHDSLFQWPDIKKDELLKTLKDKQEGD